MSVNICCRSIVVDKLQKKDLFHSQISGNWESSPRHMVRLDVRSLLQDAAIEEVWCPTYSSSHRIAVRAPEQTSACVFCQVEMEDFNPDEEPKEAKEEEEEEEGDLVRIKTALFHSHSCRQ